MEFTVRVHHEDGALWGEVVELPGCFVSGDSVDELVEALREAIPMYLEDAPPVKAEKPSIEVAELRIATSTLQPA